MRSILQQNRRNKTLIVISFQCIHITVLLCVSVKNDKARVHNIKMKDDDKAALSSNGKAHTPHHIELAKHRSWKQNFKQTYQITYIVLINLQGS